MEDENFSYGLLLFLGLHPIALAAKRKKLLHAILVPIIWKLNELTSTSDTEFIYTWRDEGGVLLTKSYVGLANIHVQVVAYLVVLLYMSH